MLKKLLFLTFLISLPCLSFGMQDAQRRAKARNQQLISQAMRGDVNRVQQLIDIGADINARQGGGYNWTPLHWAASSGYSDVVELLLRHGAQVDDQEDRGLTALHLAADNGYSKVVALLLQYNASVDVQDCRGQTPLHWVAIHHMAASQRYLDVGVLLLERGAQVDAQDYDGETPLLFAVRQNQFDLVKLLVQYGAQVDAQNKDGETLLHSAADSQIWPYGGPLHQIDMLLEAQERQSEVV